MFVFNVKLSLTKKLTTVLAVISVSVAVICIICMIKVQGNVPDSATCDEIGLYSLTAKTVDEQLEFLELFGITADSQSRRVKNILIPSDFNSVYEEYNGLQRQIGLDLNKFKGKNAQEITYNIKNADDNFAVLVVYSDKVIGAHITNGEYGGRNMPLTALWKDSTK